MSAEYAVCPKQPAFLDTQTRVFWDFLPRFSRFSKFREIARRKLNDNLTAHLPGFLDLLAYWHWGTAPLLSGDVNLDFEESADHCIAYLREVALNNPEQSPSQGGVYLWFLLVKALVTFLRQWVSIFVWYNLYKSLFIHWVSVKIKFKYHWNSVDFPFNVRFITFNNCIILNLGSSENRFSLLWRKSTQVKLRVPLQAVQWVKGERVAWLGQEKKQQNSCWVASVASRDGNRRSLLSASSRSGGRRSRGAWRVGQLSVERCSSPTPLAN